MAFGISTFIDSACRSRPTRSSLAGWTTWRIVARTRLDTAAGWPLEVSFQRDDRYLYGATRQGVYRVPLGTVDIEMIRRDEKDGPTAGGALLNGTYYFATLERLRSVPIGG